MDLLIIYYLRMAHLMYLNDLIASLSFTFTEDLCIITRRPNGSVLATACGIPLLSSRGSSAPNPSPPLACAA